MPATASLAQPSPTLAPQLTVEFPRPSVGSRLKVEIVGTPTEENSPWVVGECFFRTGSYGLGQYLGRDFCPRHPDGPNAVAFYVVITNLTTATLRVSMANLVLLWDIWAENPGGSAIGTSVTTDICKSEFSSRLVPAGSTVEGTACFAVNSMQPDVHGVGALVYLDGDESLRVNF